VARQFFGRGKDDRGRATAARVQHEVFALVLCSPAPIEADAVVAWLSGAFAIEASWLLFAAMMLISLVTCNPIY
jgi:hypothetical protein